MLKKVFKLAELEIPMLGVGTRNLMGQTCRRQVSAAMDLGYRLIDSNPSFENEMMIAEGCKHIPREELFIVSKIPAPKMDYNEAITSVEKSLKNFQYDYLDLVLIESPGKADLKGSSFRHRSYRHFTWRALVQLKKRGLVKHIGVGNYLPAHIEEMWDKYEFNPVANLMEFHPFCFDNEKLEYFKEKKIQIIAAYPLARREHELWHDPLFVEIKQELKKKKSQILLKWAIQKGVSAIPKTSKLPHLTWNQDLGFEISEETMQKLDSLSRNKKLGWDSSTIK